MIKAIFLSEQAGAGAGAFKEGFRSIIGEGKVLNKFSKKAERELGPDIVGFLKSLPKGDKLKPLDKDTLFFSTHSRPAIKSPSGEVILPAERVLHVDKIVDAGSGYGATATTNPLVLKDGHVCSYPLTLDGVKSAIETVMSSAKNAANEAKF